MALRDRGGVHGTDPRGTGEPAGDDRSTGRDLGGVAVLVALAIAVLGSGNLRWFDAALVGYLFGTLFAIFAVVYRYLIWLRRPPTARLNRRGWEAFRRRGPPRPQRRRAARAWWSATWWCSRSSGAGRAAGGSPTSSCSGDACSPALVTFPLVFGLLHFESVGQNGREYRTVVGEVGTFSFDSRSVVGLDHVPPARHLGRARAGRRVHLPRPPPARSGRAGDRAVNDFLALAGLFAVSVTGLALTASNLWMEGRFYVFLNTVHALTVILGLHVHPVREAVPHLPAAGQRRRGLLQARGRRRRRSSAAPAAGSRSRRRCRWPTSRTCCPQVGFDYSLPGRRRQLPGPLPALPPQARWRWRSPGRSAGSADGPATRSPRTSCVARYGPHLNEAPPGGWDAGVDADREVRTHCCFCGQQCGIVLKVKDDEVVGFEPWYEFPFNEGKLCPKGVKRYLQNAHPDRLLDPLERDPTRPDGFRTVVVGPRARPHRGRDPAHPGRARQRRVRHAVGRLARQREVVPDRQVRPPRPAARPTSTTTAGSAWCRPASANKRALGIDRASNPWSDIPLADVVFVIGANIAECAPITTSWIWRARDNGAKLIVADPRVTPIARTADLFLGLRPGHRLGAARGDAARAHRARTGSTTTSSATTPTGFEDAAEAVRDHTPGVGRARSPACPAARIEQAAEWWGTSKTGMLLHARGIEHHSKGVENVWACINLGLATGKYGKPGLRGHDDHRPGQRPGRPRARPQVRPAARQPRHHQPRAPRLRGVGVGLRRRRHPGQGAHRPGDRRGHPPRRDQGAAVDLLQPGGVAPGHDVHEGGARQARVLRRHRLLPVRDRVPRRRRAARVAARGGRGHLDQRRGPGHQAQPVQAAARATPASTGRSSATSPAGSARATTSRTRAPRRCSRSCAWRPRAAAPTTPASPGSGSSASSACSGRARRRTIPARRASSRAAGSTPTTGGAGSTRSATGRRPRRSTTSTRCGSRPGRVVSQYLSGTQTRRIGPLVDQYPEPLCEMHPRLAEQHGIADRRRRAGHVPARGR